MYYAKEIKADFIGVMHLPKTSCRERRISIEYSVFMILLVWKTINLISIPIECFIIPSCEQSRRLYARCTHAQAMRARQTQKTTDRYAVFQLKANTEERN